MGVASRAMPLRALHVLLFAVTVTAACSPTTSAPPVAPQADAARPAPSSAACAGTVSAASGLTETDDPALLASALGKAGEGKLCSAKVFRVTADVVAYRVWDAGNPKSRTGRWWSLARPQGPVDEYRKANAVCKAWSALDRSVTCKLKVGAKVVVGPGQSVTCDDGVVFPASPVNQVFVPDGEASLVDCSEGAPWP